MNEIFANISDKEKIKKLGKALDSDLKIDILTMLDHSSYSIHELAALLQQPVSTVAFNVKLIEEAELISTEIKPSSKGTIKICSKRCPSISIGMISNLEGHKSKVTVYSVPVGSYNDFVVSLPCGMATRDGQLFMDHDEVSLYDPQRWGAGLIWFSGAGYFEYRIPNKNRGKTLEAIDLCFEACSEAPNFRNDYKSDITVWINGVEIATWCCPGDFGGRPGNHDPGWWPPAMTQFGMFKTFTVTQNGAFLDNTPVGTTTVAQLGLEHAEYLSFRIGVKETARHKGGMNLFGKGFGDYSQDIGIRTTIENGN